MGKINLNNYEAFFLDYIENRLDESLVNDLDLFLQAYPDKKEELEALKGGFDEASDHEPIKVELSGEDKLKTRLKRNVNDIEIITEKNFSEIYIAKREGVLNRSSLERLNRYIDTNNIAKQEAELLDKAFLTPDYSIAFKSKHRLKRGFLGIKQVYINQLSVAASFAAGLALLFTVFQFQNNREEGQEISAQVFMNEINTVDVPDYAETENKTLNNNGAYIVRRKPTNKKSEAVSVSYSNNNIADNEIVQEQTMEEQTSLKPLKPINDVSIENRDINQARINTIKPVTIKKTEEIHYENTRDKLLVKQLKSDVNELISESVEGKKDNNLLQAINEGINKISKNVKINIPKNEQEQILALEVDTKLFSFYTTKVRN